MELESYLAQFDRCIANEPPFCRAACPFHADVNDIIGKFESGRVSSAYRAYRDAVGLPRTVSAICPQPCRQVCPLGADRSRSGKKDEGESGNRSVNNAESPDSNGVSGAIELRAIERSIVAEAGDTGPNHYNLPHKGKHIAVLGAGLAGFGCALRLASKNYGVRIFDTADHPGEPWMSDEIIALFEKDIKEQFANVEYSLHLNFGTSKTHNMFDLLLGGFDAVYVTKDMLGPDYFIPGLDFGDGTALHFADRTLAIFRKDNLLSFASSEACGIDSLADGFSAAQQIDGYFKTGKRPPVPEEPGTRLVLHPRKLSGADLTPKQDAHEEAARCLKCRCDACYEYCDLISYTGKWPLRIRDEVISTTLQGSAELKGTPAKRLMSMCNMCGVCKDVCPENIDIGALILAGRYRMHKLEKTPWAFHEYWISEMAHADGPSAKIIIPPEGATGTANTTPPEGAAGTANTTAAAATYAFFPGCQLGAESPPIVSHTYDALRKQVPGMGLLVRCCGVPAEWAGDADRHNNALSSITDDWKSMGSPTLVLACPTCLKKFREHLPEIPATSLYEFIDSNTPDTETETSVEPINNNGSTAQTAPFSFPFPLRSVKNATFSLNMSGKRDVSRIPRKIHKYTPLFYVKNARNTRNGNLHYAVFDPCAAGDNEDLKLAVRRLAGSAGVQVSELPVQSEIARCCGYGGQPAIADPEYSKYAAVRRAEESELPYITYCVGCRGALAAQGKETVHLLELLYASAPGSGTEQISHTASPSQRRANRERLQHTMQDIKTTAGTPDIKPPCDFTLTIGAEIAAKMAERKMLESEIYEVVAHMRSSGRTVRDAQTGTHSGCRQIGHMTYWAEYIAASGNARPPAPGDPKPPIAGHPEAEDAEELILVNVWSHRMAIDYEPVWKGKVVNSNE